MKDVVHFDQIKQLSTNFTCSLSSILIYKFVSFPMSFLCIFTGVISANASFPPLHMQEQLALSALTELV